MKGIIVNIDIERKTFYIVRKKKKIGYYLTNSTAKIFLEHLEKGLLVIFKEGIHFRQGRRQIEKFLYIKDIKTNRVIYDLNKLKSQMIKVVSSYKSLLFIDFEMTMPNYGKEFRPEIIQYGYALVNEKDEIIQKNGYYIKPKSRPLSNRTIKFLNLDEELFWSKAVEYDEFYDELTDILNMHRPQIITWGKNDITVLNDSYELNKKDPITNDKMFTDLLQLHKNYYSLKDDLGLFKAHELYFGALSDQEHDALEDAIITKKVYQGFLKEVNSK